MSLKMNEFHGIDSNHLTTLKVAGIENTDELMKIWSDKEKRAGLIATTGISEESFLKFAAMARLGRIKGMALQHLDTLVASGIDGPKRLFSHTPESLLKQLNDTVAEKKLTSSVPTMDEIKAWFANPKPEASGKVSNHKPEGAQV